MSEGSEKISTVKLSRSRIEKLKNLKRELEVSSLDEVVASLVDDFDEVEEEDAANDEPEEELPSAQKKRKKLVQPPLLSLSAMLERNGMLRYYTGLDEGTIEIVISEIKAIEVRLFFVRLVPIVSARRSDKRNFRISNHREESRNAAAKTPPDGPKQLTFQIES